MKRAIIFPGQGSQYIGMGKALAEWSPVARETFQEVDDTLNQPLTKIMFEGPEDELRMTANTQPALMAVSVAVARTLEANGHSISENYACAAGHSLGEYSALTATGALSLKDCATLLKIRGEAMQRAVPVGVGAMAALMGAEIDLVREICNLASWDRNQCSAANDNGGGQVVISGHKEAIERAIEIAKEKGVKRAVLLPVSAPFHCPLMEPAAKEMRGALRDAIFHKPAIPIIANVTAELESAPERFQNLLFEQITGTVRWRETVLKMAQEEITHVVEVGAGKVLSGLTRRIHGDMVAVSIETPEQIEVLLSE